MPISQSDLIERRRQTVYELHWKGLSTREIAKQLGDAVTYRTVAFDLEHIRKKAEDTMLEQRKYLALEHQEAIDVYRYLLRKALEQFDKADKDGNEDRKERLYPIIESINANLAATRSTRDLVETELRDFREKSNKLEKEMKIIVSATRAGAGSGAATGIGTRVEATGAGAVTVPNNDKTSGKSD